MATNAELMDGSLSEGAEAGRDDVRGRDRERFAHESEPSGELIRSAGVNDVVHSTLAFVIGPYKSARDLTRAVRILRFLG